MISYILFKKTLQYLQQLVQFLPSTRSNRFDAILTTRQYISVVTLPHIRIEITTLNLRFDSRFNTLTTIVTAKRCILIQQHIDKFTIALAVRTT